MGKPMRMVLSDTERTQAMESIRRRIRQRRTWPPISEDARLDDLEQVEKLNAEALRIVDLIHGYFPLRPLPQFDPHEQDIDYKSLRALIRDVPWDAVDGVELVRWCDWISTMDAEMLSYYLPGYLTTYLIYWTRTFNDCRERSKDEFVNFERMVDLLDPTYDYGVFHRMTKDQRACVVLFLEFFTKLGILSSGDTELSEDLKTLADLYRESIE